MDISSTHSHLSTPSLETPHLPDTSFDPLRYPNMSSRSPHSSRCSLPQMDTTGTRHTAATRSSYANPTDVENPPVEKEEEDEARESEKTNLYTWNGPDDPDHPTNWPLSKKLCTLAMLSAATLTVSLNSAMFTPALEPVMHEFTGTPREVTVLGTSLYLLVRSYSPSNRKT